MEDLTKHQIVLVTLLVSFVTSIATGIVTVALMDQAPPGVTQTINRVVERTIEKAVQSPNQSAVITKETIVVKEDDLVVSAIEKNTQSMVSIFAILGTAENYREVFLGNGLIVSKDGTIATDISVIKNILDDNLNPIPESFKAIYPGGVTLSLQILTGNAADHIAFLKPISDEKNKNPIFTPAIIVDAQSLKLGQAVIALGGEKISVSTGIVSNILYDESSKGDTASTTANVNPRPSVIKTDISVPGRALGGILVNLSGDVVGIRATFAGSGDNLFLPANQISKTVIK